jgi:hypothetical protein
MNARATREQGKPPRRDSSDQRDQGGVRREIHAADPDKAPFTTASKAAVVELPFGRGLLAAGGARMAGGAVDDFRAICAALQTGIRVIAV